MGPQGIAFEWEGLTHRFAWDQVHAVKLQRLRRPRHDFLDLELELPRCTLRFSTQYDESGPNWMGSSSAQLGAMVLAHVPADCVQVIALTGPLITEADIKERQTRLREMERALAERPRWGCLLSLVGGAGIASLCIPGFCVRLLLLAFWCRATWELRRYNERQARPQIAEERAMHAAWKRGWRGEPEDPRWREARREQGLPDRTLDEQLLALAPEELRARARGRLPAGVQE